MAAWRYESFLQVLKNYFSSDVFQHKKRNFVSPRDHVIFFFLYKILAVQQNMPYSFYSKNFELDHIHKLTVSFLFVSQAAASA